MDREEKRIDITIEAVKQQITLASAIVAAVVALAGDSSPLWGLLPWALAPFIVSIIGGVFVLLTVPFALYGTRDPFRERKVKAAGMVQGVSFCLGIALMVVMLAASPAPTTIDDHGDCLPAHAADEGVLR